MKSLKKGGQMNLSFGMIFSIILIVVFISFAFYAIGKFLDIQKTAKAGQFVDNLKIDIDKMWKSSQGSQEVEYQLPADVKYICFTDFASAKKGAKQSFYDNLKQVYFDDENLFFYPVGSTRGVDSTKIDYLDIFEITKMENPYCIGINDGEIKLTVKKDRDKALVTIMR